ncbi:MAG: tRNA pseudouridine(55) synthase TruB [Selenomonadaceae bacterium]|nr:tRNA pseudouridine(55) synthase TruB [Selenomonadaceae bacterium]
MINGFINVLKPPGMTSHDIVGFIRYNLHMKQVGHAGTLDPGAAGVLPVAVGKATRLIEYLSDAGKSYRAEILLGYETDSGDDTGKVLNKDLDFIMPDKETVLKALEEFKGEITQVPPAHSAIKINGHRACDLLRRGIEVEIPSRQVVIHKLELLGIKDDRNCGGTANILIDADCSKGTYIRSLCADIGSKLGIPATMSFLVRTRVGDFPLEKAYSIEEIKAEIEKTENEEYSFVNKAEDYLSHLRRYQLNPARQKAFCNGLSSNDYKFEGSEQALLVYSNDVFLGVGRYDSKNKSIVPVKILL